MLANPVAYSINAGLGREFDCHLFTTSLAVRSPHELQQLYSLNGENPSKKVKFKEEMSEIGQGQILGRKRIKEKN